MTKITIETIHKTETYHISDMDGKTITELCRRLEQLDNYEINDIE